MTPWAACSAATASAYGPSAPRSGTSSGTKTVTWQPSWRAVAATSEPMNPPPTIATVSAGLDCPVQVCRSAIGVVDGTQQVHPGQPDARQAAPGGGSGGDDDRVGLDLGIVGQQHRRPTRRIWLQGGGVHTEMPGGIEIFGLTFQ